MLSLSGHKLHAPKGIGALYVRRAPSFRRFMLGGHQERGRRAGTENVPYIVGLGKACELAAGSTWKRRRPVWPPCATGWSGPAGHLPGLLSTATRTPPAEHDATSASSTSRARRSSALSDSGIAASSGSACTSGSLEPSHVIRAMGVPFTAAHGSMRFLCRATTPKRKSTASSSSATHRRALRKLSPYWDGNGPVDGTREGVSARLCLRSVILAASRVDGGMRGCL